MSSSFQIIPHVPFDCYGCFSIAETVMPNLSPSNRESKNENEKNTASKIYEICGSFCNKAPKIIETTRICTERGGDMGAQIGKYAVPIASVMGATYTIWNSGGVDMAKMAMPVFIPSLLLFPALAFGVGLVAKNVWSTRKIVPIALQCSEHCGALVGAGIGMGVGIVKGILA